MHLLIEGTCIMHMVIRGTYESALDNVLVYQHFSLEVLFFSFKARADGAEVQR
jgi:hypothetical protein